MTECLQPSPAPSSPGDLLGPRDSDMFTREQHVLKLRELSCRSPPLRGPRRSHTTHEYQLPFPTVYRDAIPAASKAAAAVRILPPAENAQIEFQGATPTTLAATPSREHGARRHPQPDKPRRSYSVMDFEPVPPEHQPSANKTLLEFPSELHMAIFDFLDPIDATCLGLANKHLYAIHRRLHGTVPLSARRAGPNDMEWPWYMSGRPVQLLHKSDKETATRHPSLLRIRGKALCRKCGIYRCELHKHLKEWMPEGYEYCSVREKFGLAAAEGAREHCYRSNPNNARRCGRHRGLKGGLKRGAKLLGSESCTAGGMKE